MNTTPDPRPLDSAGKPLDLRLPDTRRDVLIKLNEMIAAYASGDQARIDLIMAEISGLAAREEREEQAKAAGRRAGERPDPRQVTAAGPRNHQPTLLESVS